MTVASTSARFHKGSGPIGQRFDVEADALWVEGKVFHEIGQAAGVSTRQVQNWARLERWKDRLEAAKRKAEALIVDRTADRLAKMALRHRRGARAIPRYAEGLLTGGPVVFDPQTGRPVVVVSGDSKPAGVEFRPIAPGELAQAAQPFSKAADLGYDRRAASSGAARPTTVSPTS